MKLLSAATFIGALLSLWVPTIDSGGLEDFIVVPVMNAFFLTLNACSYDAAMKGCEQKGMSLAKFCRTDMNSVFGPPGSTVWIHEWDSLTSDNKNMGMAITLSPNPMKPWKINGFPNLLRSSLTFPYVCQMKSV